jgi:hypothetical protein
MGDMGQPAIGYAVLTPVVTQDRHWGGGGGMTRSIEIEVKPTTSSTKYGLHTYPQA